MRDSGWSGDRMPRNRIMLIALPLIVTMAVGLIVGIRLVSEKNATLRLSNTGQGAANSTPASPASPAPAASRSATPSPTAAATPTPTATATNMGCVRIGARPPAGGACPATAACGRATHQILTSAAETAGAARSAAALARFAGRRRPDGRVTSGGRREQPGRTGGQPGRASVARPAQPPDLSPGQTGCGGAFRASPACRRGGPCRRQ